MLAVAEQGGLGTGQHQREAHGEVRPYHGTDYRLSEIGQRCVAMIQESFGIEFYPARRRGETARIAARVGLGMFGVVYLQRYTHPLCLRTQRLQGDARRRELVAVRSLNIAVPELLRKPKPASEIEDDLGVRPCLSRRRHDSLAELDQRLRFGADVEADLQRLALEG